MERQEEGNMGCGDSCKECDQDRAGWLGEGVKDKGCSHPPHQVLSPQSTHLGHFALIVSSQK